MDVGENRVMVRAGLSGVTVEGCSGRRSANASETGSALPCGDGPHEAFPSQNVGKVQAGALLSQTTNDGTFTSRLGPWPRGSSNGMRASERREPTTYSE